MLARKIYQDPFHGYYNPKIPKHTTKKLGKGTRGKQKPILCEGKINVSKMANFV